MPPARRYWVSKEGQGVSAVGCPQRASRGPWRVGSSGGGGGPEHHAPAPGALPIVFPSHNAMCINEPNGSKRRTCLRKTIGLANRRDQRSRSMFGRNSGSKCPSSSYRCGSCSGCGSCSITGAGGAAFTAFTMRIVTCGSKALDERICASSCPRTVRQAATAAFMFTRCAEISARCQRLRGVRQARNTSRCSLR